MAQTTGEGMWILPMVGTTTMPALEGTLPPGALAVRCAVAPGHTATGGGVAALPVPARPLLSILVHQGGELGGLCRAPRDHRGPAWAERLSSSRENRQGSHASTPVRNGC